MLICSQTDKFLSKKYLNSSLVALILNYLVTIREFHDLFIRSPELYLGVFSSPTLELILPEEVLVIESIEISAFTLVRMGR